MSLNTKDEPCVKDVRLIYDLQEKYELLRDDFKNFLADTDDFRVITPVVGKFSTGKSSLLNSLLGKNQLNKFYLGVDLTPETAVPTEITYDSPDKIVVVDNDGHGNEIGLNEYHSENFSATQISKIRLMLDNEFLKSISTVKIVDMPGFDSGVELHNRAIDEYLPQSHAYILIFAATEPVIPESIANFLRELKIYKMPVYIVITKSRSVADSQLAECVENIRRNAADYLGLKDINICCTNAKGKHIEIQPFAKILQDIESDSRAIFVERVNAVLHIEAERLANYLRAVIRQTDLTPSELEYKKEECRRNLEDLKARLAKTKQEFAAQTDSCINSIQSKVTESLYNSASSLEVALMNHGDINSKVNALVRETVLSAMQNEFAPKFRRYVEKINSHIRLDINPNLDLKVDERNFAVETAIQTAVAGAVKNLVPKVLGAFGLAVSGPVAALIGVAASLLFSSAREESRQNDQLMQARRQVHNEIIPQITAQVGDSIRKIIYSQIDNVNAQLDEEALQQIRDQEKILAEITSNLEIESTARAEKLRSMNEDLETVNSILSRIEVTNL